MIPGVERTDFDSIEIGYPNGPMPLYGEDNLPDPWSNPQIQLLQKAFNPVAAVDTAFWNANKLSNAGRRSGRSPRPRSAPDRTPGRSPSSTTPSAAQRVDLTWTLRAGSADGPWWRPGRSA